MSEAATPGHTRCTIVFLERGTAAKVLGACWIECPTARLEDAEYRRYVMEQQQKLHGPSTRHGYTKLLVGDYTQGQACMALAAGLEAKGVLE